MDVLDRRAGERDSHDLSLHFTRFSVVDSMLTSLSDFPSAANSAHQSAYPEFDSNDYKHISSHTGRPRGHTHTSSMSDYDVHVDEIASRYNAYHSRSRQNTIQSKNPTKAEGKRKQSNASIRTAATATRGTTSRHTRGTDVAGSKGSGSSSMDLGYGNSLPNAAFRHAPPHRAASFDHSYDRERVATNASKMSSLMPSVPLPVDYSSMDAAPMPTVPAGPRRPQEPLSPIHIPNTPGKKGPSRKNSVKSSAGKSMRRVKSSVPVDSGEIRDQAKQFVHATNNMRTVHSGVPNGNGAAPSPNVGKMRNAFPSSPAQPPPPPKEKGPGFFRRVFGSSKHNQNQQHEESHRPPSPAAIRQMPSNSTSNRPRTQPSQQHQQHSASQSKPTSRRPSTQETNAPIQPPQALRKAHSSFFRRRKKSLPDSDPPPLPPLQLPPRQSYAQLKISAPQRSPSAQSLRGAMAQYLTDKPSKPSSPLETFFDSREHQPSHEADEIGVAHGVSPREREQLRNIDANLGALQGEPARQGTNGEAGDRPSKLDEVKSPNSESRDLQSGSQPTSTSNMRSHTRLDLVGNVEGHSFLADSSSNEAMVPSIDDLYRGRGASYDHSAQKQSKSPARRASNGQTRGDVQMLSPISDRSYNASDGERPSRFAEDIAATLAARDDGSLKSARIWLEPSASEEKLSDLARLKLPIDGPRVSERLSPVLDQLSPTSESDVFASASSLPIVQVESKELRMSQDWAETDAAKAILTHDTDITPSDRERAKKIFDGDEEYVPKSGAAAWLGQTTPKSARTRRAYMELYEWNGVNILAAFRELCGRLVVKAESQQLDRVIDAFSERWCNCNPHNGFKDRDVVHTITFSILMLNTDLHIADLDQRMTRSQFVKNTLPTIRSIADASAPDATETMRALKEQKRAAIPWDQPSSPSSPAFPPESVNALADDRPSLEVKRPNRLSLRPSAMRNESDGADGTVDNCNVLVKAPFEGSMKGWEFQVEIVLKEFYNSVRQQRLPLHGAPTNQVHPQPSTGGLSVMTNALRRTPSVLSKAPSETISYRGRTSDGFRNTTGRFSSKARSRPRIYPTSTIGSSRTSLDDQSVWSPAGSTWSKYSLGKTQTSMSVDSLGSHFGHQDYQQAIGFANALSQAIIREDAATYTGSDDFNPRALPLLEDETLELVGSPWAKEGMVKHKHHLESLEKKAKERNWSECFAVIEKGWMRLFSFSTTSKSSRQRAKSRAASTSGRGGVVGGGNWTENAEELTAFLLRQTFASALPPPGYSKSRAHVFALSLPTGAVHLFQVGTPDIVKEFVATVNYWSARLSKEPLVGGVSNIEYGWGENVVNMALLQRPDSSAQNHTGPPGTASTSNSHPVASPGRHASLTSPLQSPSSTMVGLGRRSEDQGPGSMKARLPGDRVVISEWKPPVQSMMASQLMEVDQLRALLAYVSNVEDELQKHNELRSLMGMAFSPRHPNAGKAMNNWEKKSAYLLREIVKFRTYIDSLTAAQTQKEKLYKEREESGAPAVPNHQDDQASEHTAAPLQTS